MFNPLLFLCPTYSVNYLLFDLQPVFSSSVIADMMRPDGSSTIQVLSGDSLSAELAHELMCIQVRVGEWFNEFHY